uniref:Uncharacterized protein n=1 Tax=Avena sativa TaxID=4498 RepID=A0ACD5WG95_AVESA
MIDRWDLEDTPETEEKILKIAQERYRGWRATLPSTYKAYKTDAARLANVPEDLQPEEWEWFMEYVATDSKFQQRSQKNSDNRKKQKTKHRIGSKSYSQISFEKRDLETGEEPDCVALWELTHTKNGAWSNKDSQDVYFEEQAREFQKKNVELCQHVTELQDQLQAERESTQERINLERAEREILEEKLEQERADRKRLLEEERRSRKEFEKNMMEKFAKMSQMFETQQITNKRNAKENSNPNFQSTPSRTPSKSGTIGTRQSLIAPNTLIQASTKNSRIFRALEQNN